jgi:hypothetical protein
MGCGPHSLPPPVLTREGLLGNISLSSGDQAVLCALRSGLSTVHCCALGAGRGVAQVLSIGDPLPAS